MLFALARGSSKRLPADPCPVRMGEGSLGGSWRTPLDGGPLVPQALLPWQIAGAADLMRRGFWHCALLAARPAPVIAFCALLRLAWKSSRHSHTSFIVASRLRHTHISGLPVGGRWPSGHQNCRLWATLESDKAIAGTPHEIGREAVRQASAAAPNSAELKGSGPSPLNAVPPKSR
jgi:hypothetical protein